MSIIEKFFMPSDYVESYHLITPKFLKSKNIYAIITDLDNTLVAYDEADATDEVLSWLKCMNESDVKVMVVSNGKNKRVTKFCKPHNIDYIDTAKKPLSRAFIKAMKHMGSSPNNTVVIGDQLMTDILGANRVGLQSILVKPVKSKDGLATILNRKLEKQIIKYFKKHGLVNWEDNHE